MSRGKLAKKLDTVLASIPSSVPKLWVWGKVKKGQVGIGISFSMRGYGFGDVSILQDKDGQVYIDSERTDPGRVALMFSSLLKGAIWDWTQDKKAHRKYCKAMEIRSCGCGCGWSS